MASYTPYLIMDYCAGGTLRQRHPRGTRVSLHECIAYIKQIAEALQHAHDRKFIHRDVKPENMLVNQNETLLLSDFGIAIVSQSSRYQRQDIGGTIAYSAPEQLQGKAGPASDQYSLAVVLYEWLTGELPYQGSFAEIASQHLVAPIPPISDKVPSLPLAVEQVLQKALAKKPFERFQHVRDFAQALEMAEEGILAPTVLQTRLTDDQAPIATYIKTQLAIPTESPAALTTPKFMQASLSTSSPRLSAYQPGKAQSHRGKTGFLLIIILLLALTLAGVSIRTLLVPSVASVQNGNIASQTQSGDQAQSPDLSSTGVSVKATRQPTPTSTPTPSSQTLSKNIRLTCVSVFPDSEASCSDIGITVELNTIVIDPSGPMIWTLTLMNEGTQPVTIAGSSGYPTSSLYLKDSTGASIDATGGTFLDDSALAGGQSLPVTAIFPLRPQPGATYLLHTELGLTSDAYFSSLTITYKTINFTF